MTKAYVETPLVRAIRLGPPALAGVDEAVVWMSLGERWREDARLDASSRALVRSKRSSDWGASPKPLDDAAFAELVESFERGIASDTARGELLLCPRLRRWILADPAIAADLTALNARVYAELFLTPADDPWRGMATPGAVVGLLDDGIIAVPAAVRP